MGDFIAKFSQSWQNLTPFVYFYFTSFVDIIKFTCQSLRRTYTKSGITDCSTRSKIQVSKLNSVINVSTSAPMGVQSRTGLRLRLSGLGRLLSKRNSATHSVPSDGISLEQEMEKRPHSLVPAIQPIFPYPV